MDRKCPHRELLMAILAHFFIWGGDGSKSAERLYDKLITNYSALYRPVENDTDKVVVYLGMDLSQLVDIDEQNEMMITSVWLKQQWRDHKLVWDPQEYEGIEWMKFEIDQIWYPDLVLYNTAEGSYAVELISRATVRYDGVVKWNPPAIFRSSCNIDIEHFPFDVQLCYMKFGAWTHDGSVMELLPIDGQVGRKDYRENGEWEIQDNPAKRYEEKYACCQDIFIDIKFFFVLKRNPLFYVITLVIPCILIAFLTLSVFFISSDAQEKITLSISVLLALIVFLLLIPSIVPPTSKTIPLIVKYLLFTMGTVAVSIVSTVFTINLHFRTSLSHQMPRWLRRIFLEVLPKFLLIERPQVIEERREKHHRRQMQKDEQIGVRKVLATMDEGAMVGIRSTYNKELLKNTDSAPGNALLGADLRDQHMFGHTAALDGGASNREKPPAPHGSIAGDELVSAQYDIVGMLRESYLRGQMEEEWTYVGLVIDRLLLYLFSISVFVGTVYICILPPSLWQDDVHNQIPEETVHAVPNDTVVSGTS